MTSAPSPSPSSSALAGADPSRARRWAMMLVARVNAVHQSSSMAEGSVKDTRREYRWV